MDVKNLHENQSVISSTTGSKMNISEVESVAKSWMIDFNFLSLCRYYREQNAEKFSKTLKVFEAMIDDEHQLQDNQEMKRTICCLLSRIMDGKNLEKGNVQLAAHTLQWLETERDLPQKLQRKLSTIVSKKDVYNQLFTRFSFNHLLKSVNLFLDTFLEKHPSDFLLKAASKVVQACQERPEQANVDQKKKEPEPGSPVKKLSVSVAVLLLLAVNVFFSVSSQDLRRRPFHQSLISEISRQSIKLPSPQTNAVSKCRSKRKWMFKEDMYLKAGVKKHGEGKWSKILEEYEFEDRTSVMLKDRWRTLKKQGKV
ncbi:Telomeric repeat-binding factor 1 [Bagarius yarrelli]|uniref:Telomeric repeat-binding factor 1 n=1 Tax=Bagarius yarrelli TaxID=175774 RepID=A0A556TWC6_BAGYA|nr:Telomeric repeat-binding factor 1 [Bagarius yarrelli]